jgi:hypothetical protein
VAGFFRESAYIGQCAIHHVAARFNFVTSHDARRIALFALPEPLPKSVTLRLRFSRLHPTTRGGDFSFVFALRTLHQWTRAPDDIGKRPDISRHVALGAGLALYPAAQVTEAHEKVRPGRR